MDLLKIFKIPRIPIESVSRATKKTGHFYPWFQRVFIFTGLNFFDDP